MKKPSTSLLIKIVAAAAAVAAVVTMAIIYRKVIAEFIDNMGKQLCTKRKSKFQEYFDFEDLDSI